MSQLHFEKIHIRIKVVRLCRIHVDPFGLRHALNACMVAPTKIIAGLGMSLGMQHLQAPGATGACAGPLSFERSGLHQEATFLPPILGLRALCLHRGLQDSPACKG